MSYILEALRRSQAERERGQVPGLHARPAPAEPAPGPRGRPAMLWLAVGLTLGTAAGLAAWWLRPPAAAGVNAAATVSAIAPVTAPRTAPVTASAMAPPVPATAPALPAPAFPVVVSAPVAAVPVSTPPRAPAPMPAPVTVPTAPVAAASTSHTLPLAQLSAEQRRELPPMAIGGSIWSENAANRFVIVNGQVVREGEAAAPGVMLERITPKAVVLRWRELRIEIPT